MFFKKERKELLLHITQTLAKKRAKLLLCAMVVPVKNASTLRASNVPSPTLRHLCMQLTIFLVNDLYSSQAWNTSSEAIPHREISKGAGKYREAQDINEIKIILSKSRIQ